MKGRGKMAKHCARCGRFYPDDHQFCPTCTISLVRSNVMPATVTSTPDRKGDEGQGSPVSGIKRDHFKEGHDFEIYVANSLFPRPYFDVEDITPRRDDLKGRYIASAKNPDLKIRHIKSDHVLWIECKWRTSRSLVEGRMRVCKNEAQFLRYKEFQEKHPRERVYIVMGWKPSEAHSLKMYCIPLYEMKQPWLYPKVLKSYERSPNEPFQYWYGRLR